MIKVTREFLIEKNACVDGYEWWCENCEGLETGEQIRKLNEYNNDWANWLIVRIMDYKQYVSYAVFAAEQVIDIYENEYPDNKAPRKAIEAAKKCIENPSEENKRVAYTASRVVANTSVAYVAYAAANASDANASDANASYAAANAVYHAVDNATKKEMQNKIIEYGIKLLGGEDE